MPLQQELQTCKINLDFRDTIISELKNEKEKLESRIAELEAENEKLKKMYEAGEKLLSCIPLNNGNVYLVGFDEALNEWRNI